MVADGKFQFAIDRGGTFTDVFARCPNGRVRVLKLLSEDPQHYKDAPTEGIRRILQEVSYGLKWIYLIIFVFDWYNYFVFIKTQNKYFSVERF